jgi:hypothetical protein
MTGGFLCLVDFYIETKIRRCRIFIFLLMYILYFSLQVTPEGSFGYSTLYCKYMNCYKIGNVYYPNQD